jgi:hypothetical protein
MIRTIIQRARPYQAVLEIDGQLPTLTTPFLACDDVQAARLAVADWAGLGRVVAIERIPLATTVYA